MRKLTMEKVHAPPPLHQEESVTHTRFALYVGDNGRRKLYPLAENADAPEYVDCFDGTRLPLVMVARYSAGTVQSAELLSERTARIAERNRQDAAQHRSLAFYSKQYGRAS